jgi:hypothetical protein
MEKGTHLRHLVIVRRRKGLADCREGTEHQIKFCSVNEAESKRYIKLATVFMLMFPGNCLEGRIRSSKTNRMPGSGFDLNIRSK